MVGVSYPGISQLFVASTQPPSLAAITPLSVIEDSYGSVVRPGGLLNTGFGVEWAQQRMDETRPEGQEWAAERIAGGDTDCAANQRLRLQNPDLVAQIDANPYYTAELSDPLAPRTFVDQIEVPVFLAGAWQDEQTGGRFATMLDRFTGTDHFYATLVNGLHSESIGAGVFPRFVEFLDLYVAQRVPSLDAARGVAPVLASGIFGTDQVALPPDRFAGQSYEQALAAFESEPPIQVLFEEGAADGALPGTPVPRWSQSFDAWPVPGAVATPWYLAADGTLSVDAPAEAGEASYAADPSALPATFFDDSGDQSIWAYDVQWQWQQPPEGTAASFISAPLTADTVVVGSGSADLWIRSDAEDTDLEVTISEVRPDGQEVYVQSGWLRASMRALDESASTELRPLHTYLEDDAEPLPPDEWTAVRVELLPVAHAFRAGSQVRVTIDAPGNSRADWAFDTISAGETVDVASVVTSRRGSCCRSCRASRCRSHIRRARCAASRVAAGTDSLSPVARLTVLDLGGRGRRCHASRVGGVPARQKRGAVARAGLPATWPQPAHARAATRRGRPPRRRVRHLVHVAGAGPSHQRFRRRAAGDRTGVAPRRRRPGAPRLARPSGVSERDRSRSRRRTSRRRCAG